ncbi:MAG: hypothetical protein K9L30_18285 [Desulfobacterales bacterium]|nr:hypothetical protein [Desulfobacterales bacterium]
MRIDDSSIRVDRDTCIACGICVERCIMDNLRLSVAPCRQACPINMNCQGYIRLIALGQEDMAIQQLLPFGPLLNFIAEKCTAPCEKVCVRKQKDGALHILELKRYLVKKYRDQLNTINVSEKKSNKTIGIIGTGISGLACGFKAIQSGHSVFFFTRSFDAGKKDNILDMIRKVLENFKAVFLNDKDLVDSSGQVRKFDALVLSSLEDQQLLGSEFKPVPENTHVDKISHQLHENIFCSDTGASKNNPVFEIARAFETIESVNRFLNNEPLDWGRGFYTQEGAVKAYKTDFRVGNDEPRIPMENVLGKMDADTAKKQASRCFSCGRAFEKNQTCWYCLPCELECPQKALYVDIPYLVK